jgi:hypothetical protein
VRGEEISKAMKTMAIGDIMPREEDDDEGPSIYIQVNPSTSTTNDHDQQNGNSSNNDSPQEDDQMAHMTTPSPSTQEPIDQPIIHHEAAKDHPVDQIMGDICRMDLPGPTTSVGTRTDYSVGPWDYLACAARHLLV